MSKVWLKNGKVVMQNGAVTLCDSCPCYEPELTCSERVNERVAQYLQELEPDGITYKWHWLANYPNMYTCAQFSYDAEQQLWHLVTPASGYLWVMFRNNPLSSQGYYFIEGTLLEDNDGNLKLVACRCTYTGSGGKTCSSVLDEYNDYWVAGALPVQDFDDSDSDSQNAIDNYNPCQPVKCDVLKLFMSAGQDRWGGELFEEGYVEHNTTPCEPQEYPRKDAYYMQAWVFFWDNGTGMKRYANLLRCGCESIVMDYDFNETKETSDSSDSDGLVYTYEYRSLTGICTSPCQMALTLANSAVENHQKLYHEGCFFPRDGHMVYMSNPDDPEAPPIPDRYVWDDTYNFSQTSDFYTWWDLTEHYWKVYRFLMCKDNGDGSFSMVTCECDEIHTIDINNFETMMMAVYPTDGKGIILPIEYKGACKCIDLREIVMAHTEEFGIVDAIMGSNAIYRVLEEGNKTIRDDRVSPAKTYTTDIPKEHVCLKYGHPYGGGAASIVDYRTLCVIKQCYDGMVIYALTPDRQTIKDVYSILTQEFIPQPVITCASKRNGEHLEFTGEHFEPYTSRASMDSYHFIYNGGDFWYDPDDPESEMPWYCDVGENSVIYEPDGRHVYAVVRAELSQWYPQGYECICEGDDWVVGCHTNNGYGPPLDWGNPVGHISEIPEGMVYGVTTNRGFLTIDGDYVNELHVTNCDGDDYIFASMTPKGEPHCVGHRFDPPEWESDSSTSEEEE